MASGDRKFERFIGYLLAHKEPCETAARLQREGVDLLRAFVEARVYIEGRSVVNGRRARHKAHKRIVNRAVREGIASDVGAWLLARAELAFSTSGFARVHCLDSLCSLHIYLEWQTGRRVLMRELGDVVDAALWALGRKNVCDPMELARELRRHRERHPRFVALLKQEIER